MSENRLLILLNPGRQSRHYMLGLARAAARLGVPHACVEMEDLWLNRDAQARSRGMMAACVQVQLELSRLVRRHSITHVLGYAWNGAMDFGLLSREPGTPGEPIFAALGVRHIMLWTDHPDWFNGGAALRPEFVRRLDHPLHTHILKSRAAAQEASAVLGWRNTVAMPMAEDLELFDGAIDSARVSPEHDVVAIMGGASPLPAEISLFLDDEAPDPREMDCAALPGALARWRRWVGARAPSDDLKPLVEQAGEALLSAKIEQPLRSYWSLAGELSTGQQTATAWMQAEPERWYEAVAVLRRLGEWRRGFYPAWLSRRVDVGVYGSSAAALGIEQRPGAEQWVEYEQQSAVYRRGRTAININAVHDEEGCTHKPFQIAASGTACVHHASAELDELFEPGQEIEAFDRPAELLETIRAMRDDRRRAVEVGAAMRERAGREHTWDQRLVRMMQLADGSKVIAPEPLSVAA